MNNSNNIADSPPLGFNTQKEIYEIPQIVSNVLKQKDLVQPIAEKINEREVHHIYLIGAGSSYNAGFAMSYMFNRITEIPTFTEYSMEFQYLIKPILQKEDCLIALSQSGETVDTIEAIKIGKKKGCLIIAITNNLNSELAKASEYSISLMSEEEKSVLATKTYISQLAVLSMLALEIAMNKKSMSSDEYNKIWIELIRIPDKINSVLKELHEQVKLYSQYFKFAEFCFVLGSGPDYATAMEGSLKLKEGARIFGQAYSTAEFPHGPITLADSRTCIIAIIPHEDDERKLNLLNLLTRIKERKATILGIYESIIESDIPEPIDFGLIVPNTIMDLQPLVMIIAVQLLTLEISRIKGINCDTPKYLTKVSNI